MASKRALGWMISGAVLASSCLAIAVVLVIRPAGPQPKAPPPKPVYVAISGDGAVSVSGKLPDELDRRIRETAPAPSPPR